MLTENIIIILHSDNDIECEKNTEKIYLFYNRPVSHTISFSTRVKSRLFNGKYIILNTTIVF